MKTVRKKQRHVADAQLAAMVIAMRLPVIVMESMTDKAGRPEANRAVSEKVAAAVDGVVQAQLSIMNTAATFWLDVMSGKSPASLINTAVSKATDAALKPGRKTLRSNYKRLVPGT